MRRRWRGLSLALSIGLVLAACGGAPLESIGARSSEWINEPTVPTTLEVVTTVPTVIEVSELQWSNDVIENENLDDLDLMLDEVFGRRQGDRFIQASRFEIVAALPDVAFPGLAPPTAQWVSSQLVFDNDGTLADDPSAAFGIWSAEPYTRSRSVAQLAVLRVSNDPETATEVATADDASCARFAERTTDQCEIVEVGLRDTWLLTGPGGTTLIWFEGPYRYELFGRSFIPVGTLREMSGEMTPLATINTGSS
ncbi:MAG TPA: hypothetical protein VJ948_12555 [Acidimicrobiia bacterium]|nr:hypothetical protein [Acidimicrobiia bacterium]